MNGRTKDGDAETAGWKYGRRKTGFAAWRPTRVRFAMVVWMVVGTIASGPVGEFKARRVTFRRNSGIWGSVT